MWQQDQPNQRSRNVGERASFTANTSPYLSARPSHQAPQTLSPSVSQNLRQSRYSPTRDEFNGEVTSASQTFRSPARGAASFMAPRPFNSASTRYSVLGNLNRRNRSVSQHEVEVLQPVQEHRVQYSGDIRNTMTSNEVDHSIDLGSDFSKFLFEDQLADIKIHVSRFSPDEEVKERQLTKTPLQEKVEPAEQMLAASDFVVIPAHRIVLASRCQYFYAKFCREWGDGNALVAKFPEFTERPMREFLRYLYTGKLRIELGSVMGIMRISSYFNMDELVKSCKMYLRSGKLNAFDLCILYCEVREGSQDFDDMRSFLTTLIPKKMDNRILCRVLKRIWVSPRHSQNLETVTEEHVEELETNQTVTDVEEQSQSGSPEEQLIEKAKALAKSSKATAAATPGESKVIKFNTCLSDDHDSDTIKFEDAINDSETAKKTAKVEQKPTKLKNQVKESQSSAGVVITSTEIAEEETNGEANGSEENCPQESSAVNTAKRLDVGRDSRRVHSSNEFENEERRDLQQILMEKLQLSLPIILQEEQTKEELLMLPREALELLFSNSETCLSEFQLFEVIQRKLVQLADFSTPFVDHNPMSSMEETKVQPPINQGAATLEQREYTFLKEMLKFVRLPLINMKQLVTSIKFSAFFEDQAIFEALQFQVAKEVLASERLESDIKYEHRGIRTHFDHKHYDLSIQEEVKDQCCLVTTDAGTSFMSHQKVQKSLTIKRDRVCQSPDDSTISAIMGESLPLHGIHYWELKLKTDNPANLKKVFIGLCNKRDNGQLEDVYRSKSAILLNCFDSTFWNNGQQVQVFSNKYIKIRQPMEDTDIIRIAIDLRHADHFERFWQDQQQDQQSTQPTSQENHNLTERSQHPRSLDRAGQHRSNNQDYVFGRNSVIGGRTSAFNSGLGGDFGANSDRYLLRDRYRGINTASMGAPRNPRENINLLLNANNEVMFFNSPCKFHFAFNNSDFHEGVDLNLINLDVAPTNLCVSLPEHLGVEVQMSRAVYFCDWELIPKEPFLFS